MEGESPTLKADSAINFSLSFSSILRVGTFFQLIDLIFVSALSEGVQKGDVATVNELLQYDNVDRKNFNVNGSLHDT